jgi:predicted Co/Zn/Cd cation transporter (cation efflux family)
VDRLLARDLRAALAVALFVELGFVVAILALAGVFNGGQPTTTPALAVAYILVGAVVTIAVVVRTAQMLRTAQRGDVDALRRLHVRAWTWVAFVFSAVLPSFFLNDAATILDRGKS